VLLLLFGFKDKLKRKFAGPGDSKEKIMKKQPTYGCIPANENFGPKGTLGGSEIFFSLFLSQKGLKNRF